MYTKKKSIMVRLMAMLMVIVLMVPVCASAAATAAAEKPSVNRSGTVAGRNRIRSPRQKTEKISANAVGIMRSSARYTDSVISSRSFLEFIVTVFVSQSVFS